jgi:hypothetical protein
VPTRPSDPSVLIREMVARVEAAEQVMVEKIARSLAKGNPEAPDWVLKKQTELQRLRAALQRDAEALARGLQRDIPLVVGGAFDWGAADAALDVSEATGGPAPALGEGTLPAARVFAVQTIAQDILRAVDTLPQAVLRNASDAYQRVVAQGVSSVLLGAETRRAVTQRAVNQLLGEGIRVFTDRRGRDWSLPTYVEMATRTGVAKAAVDGHVQVLKESGLDHVHIIPGPYPCPVCDVWASKVLRRDGTVEGDEPSLEDARAAGWGHPNCRCSVALWVEGFSELVTERPSREGYEDDQEQRRIERGIRKWKLREAAAMSPEAKAQARGKVREWQGQMRAHLDAHPGLKRQPKREALFRP